MIPKFFFTILVVFALASACSSSASSSVSKEDTFADVVNESSILDPVHALQSMSALSAKESSSLVLLEPTNRLDPQRLSVFSWKQADELGTLSFAPPGVEGGLSLLHGPSLNGSAYFLVFQDQNNASFLRVFTQKTTYTPSEDVWKRLSSTSFKLRIYMGLFENNLVLSGGGPYVSKAYEF